MRELSDKDDTLHSIGYERGYAAGYAAAQAAMPPREPTRAMSGKALLRMGKFGHGSSPCNSSVSPRTSRSKSA